MDSKISGTENAPDQDKNVVNDMGDEDSEDQSTDHVVLLEAAEAVHTGNDEYLHDAKVKLKSIEEGIGETW